MLGPDQIPVWCSIEVGTSSPVGAIKVTAEEEIILADDWEKGPVSEYRET